MNGAQEIACDAKVGLRDATPSLPRRSSKDRSGFLSVLQRCIEKTAINVNDSVLIIGGTQEDADSLRQCGFHRITLSNIHGVPDDPDDPNALPVIAVDAEDIKLPDNSCDVVFFHEVIHHCRSPHRALCEMLRIAKRRVVMMEPNDSAFMRLLCRLRFSYPYEIFAVVNNEYVRGGVRNSQIPNYIFRWNAWAVHQLASAFLAEYKPRIYADPYWEFNAKEKNLADRKQTKIGVITGVIGASNFLRILHGMQRVLNQVPVLRRQGNKFFCSIEKDSNLQPWLKLDSDGTVIFDRRFQRSQQDANSQPAQGESRNA
jgi:SAM-dependent methyltransferase